MGGSVCIWFERDYLIKYYCIAASFIWHFFRAADITEEEARTALLEYVAEHYCYGKGAAEKMQIRNVRPSNALHVS